MKKVLFSILAMGALSATSYGQTHYSQDFESTTGTALPTGYTQTVVPASGPNDSVGWNSGTNTTLGSSYFSPNAHTRFVAVNDDKKKNADNSNSFMSTATFSIPASSSVWLSFDCSFLHKRNSTSGPYEIATVEISTDGGTTWTVIPTGGTLAANAMYWWEPRYINLTAYAGNPNVKLGFRYKDGGDWLYGFAIDNIKVYTPPANDIQMLGIAPMTGSPASYGLAGSNITITGGVFNNGGSTITSYDVKYVFNGGATVTNTITGSIAPFTTATFTATTPVTLPAAVGPYPLQVWLSLSGDANATNDSAKLDTLNTVAFLPHKKLAIEEGTGTWCGWCVRGIVYMDSLRKLYGDDVSLIAVHNSTSDPMQVPAYDSYISSKVSGYPSVLIDRRVVDDPGNLLSLYTQHSGDFGFADINFTYTLSGTSLTVPVTVKPAVDLTNARLAMAITEDRVHGTASGYAQHNYYSFQSQNQPLTGGGVNYQDSLATIPATSMHYDHVARAITPSATGASGLLPTSMVNGSTYNYTFNTTINSSWDTSKMHIVVMLIDNVSGAVLNSQNVSLHSLAIPYVTKNIGALVVYPNPATDKVNITFDAAKSTTVKVSVYDIAGRCVLAAAESNVAAGTDHITIPVSNFTNGMYTVKLESEEGVLTEMFTVTK